LHLTVIEVCVHVMATVHLRPRSLAYVQQVQALLELGSLEDALHVLVNGAAPEFLQRLTGQPSSNTLSLEEPMNYPRLTVVTGSPGSPPGSSPGGMSTAAAGPPVITAPRPPADPVLHHLAAVLPEEDF
jgi:hypothetical protein